MTIQEPRPAPSGPNHPPAGEPGHVFSFLFTDIQGSTRRWDANATLMAAELARHDALLRTIFEAHGGRVFKTVGDGFCVAFADGDAATAAAVAAQRSLAELPVGELGPLLVRVAVHTGAAEQREGDYFGPALNRVARLVAVAHGGQTLFSAATAELARGRLPSDVELRDLGEHGLRDLPQPEHIYQVVIPGLPADFPPLRTVGDHSARHLPAQATVLVGREREADEARAMLLRDDVRLLTLTGPGGIGKTRLSLKLAESLRGEFPDGVHFVELAAVDDAALVLPEIARRVGLRETPERPLAETLAEHLRGRRLLVLDNFEQITAAGPAIAELERACPTLKVLVSSRETLRVYGEHEYRVPPLSIGPRDPSPTAEALLEFEAVRLFVDRARSVRSDFALTDQNAGAIAEICRRVDGLPLAIELVANRVRSVPPEAILARMDRRLPLLTGGARDLPARQQTLRGAIAWSYDLLTEPERELLRRLGAFAGSFGLESVEALCPDQLEFELIDALDLLSSKSLLVADVTGAATRYAMLQTIREFSLEQLRWSGEEEDVRERHAGHFLTLAERAEPMLRGAEQTAWSERLEQEHDNLRSALEWLVDVGRAEEAWRLAGALYPFWSLRGYFGEARALLDRAVAVGADQPSVGQSAARARALHAAGRVAQLSDPVLAGRLYEESLAIRRALGDVQGIVSSLNQLGQIARFQGDYSAARDAYAEALTTARGARDEWAATILLYNLSILARLRGDHAQARMLAEESVALARQRQDVVNTANALDALGEVDYEEARFDAARALLEEALDLHRRTRHRQGEGESLWQLGNIARECGQHNAATTAYAGALAAWQAMGYRRGIGMLRVELGLLAAEQGDADAASAHLSESLELLRELGERRYLAYALEALAVLACLQRESDEAFALVGAASGLRASIGSPRPPVDDERLDRWLRTVSEGLTFESEAAARSLGAVTPIEDLIRAYTSSL